MKWLLRIGGALITLFIILFAVAYIWSDGASGSGEMSHTITIDRPAEDIWPYLVEADKFRQWLVDVVEERPINGDSLRVGAKSIITVQTDEDEHFEMESEVTGLTPGRMVQLHFTAEFFEQDATYKLQENGSATTVSYHAAFQFKPFMFRLMAPLITPAAQARIEEDMARLKALVESS